MRKKEAVIDPELIPWVRVPEPTLETAIEYAEFAKRSFRESDWNFARRIVRRIPRDFEDEGEFIDIGCGPGQIAIFVAKLRPHLKLTGVDLNQEMLEQAKENAKMEGISPTRIIWERGNMTELKTVLKIKRHNIIFISSNTALHELDKFEDLEATMDGLGEMVRERGGLLVRDLLLPKNGKQARRWRQQVIPDESQLSARERELFYNSQHAGWSLHDVEEAMRGTLLEGRSSLKHLDSPSSRYWELEVVAPTSGNR